MTISFQSVTEYLLPRDMHDNQVNRFERGRSQLARLAPETKFEKQIR